MTNRSITVIGIALIAALVLPVHPVGAHHRSDPHFRDVWCDKWGDGSPTEWHAISREGARSYGMTADRDGYQWGGGCWNSNKVDDQPNDPPQDTSTGGEGGDCSGFVFKTWFLSPNRNNSDFYWWDPLRYRHGPYTASAFKAIDGAPLGSVKKKEVQVMDAFASTGHIGMIQTPLATPDGQDLILEAKSERDGTGVWARTYRSNPKYSAVQRKGWIDPRPPNLPCVWGCDIAWDDV